MKTNRQKPNEKLYCMKNNSLLIRCTTNTNLNQSVGLAPKGSCQSVKWHTCADWQGNIQISKAPDKTKAAGKMKQKGA